MTYDLNYIFSTSLWNLQNNKKFFWFCVGFRQLYTWTRQQWTDYCVWIWQSHRTRLVRLVLEARWYRTWWWHRETRSCRTSSSDYPLGLDHWWAWESWSRTRSCTRCPECTICWLRGEPSFPWSSTRAFSTLAVDWALSLVCRHRDTAHTSLSL